MEIKAKLSYIRISPRKVRMVTDLVRGLRAVDAVNQLTFSIKKGSLPVLKLLNSAIANAKHNFGIEKENLYIEKLIVNTAPMMKRWKARSRGMANPIKKRSSHIELILRDASGAKVSKPFKKFEAGKGGENQEKSEKIEKVEKKPAFRPEKERPTKLKKEGIGQKIFRRKAF
jgi:large subunit ribosomal protein L22